MRSEDELRELLTQAADEIAAFSGNPRTWMAWIAYLLEQLEKYSMAPNPMYRDLYQDMLSALQDAIRNRQKTGGW